METQLVAVPEVLSAQERIAIIMHDLIVQREQAVLEAVICAIKRGERRAVVGDVVYDNIKSKEEVIAQLNGFKRQSEEPLYVGPPAAFLDEMLAKLQSRDGK